MSGAGDRGICDWCGREIAADERALYNEVTGHWDHLECVAPPPKAGMPPPPPGPVYPVPPRVAEELEFQRIAEALNTDHGWCAGCGSEDPPLPDGTCGWSVPALGQVGGWKERA